MATKNIVNIDFVDFFSPAIVRSLHENYCPPRPVHAARSISNPCPPTSRSPGAPPTIGHGKPNTTQTTPISLGSTTVLDLALRPVAWLPAYTAGLQTRHPGALASQGLSTVLDVEVSSWQGAGVHPSHLRCANLSGRCHETTLAGAHHGFTASCKCSAFTPPKRQSQST